MKKLLLLLMGAFLTFTLSAQTVVYQDNFDSYTAGTALTVQNSTNWTTWTGVPGSAEDPKVSTEQSQTAPNSVKLTGDNDIIYKFANQTTGAYKIEFDYYIPSSGMGGYFNIQHYANPGQQWACEIYFYANGNGYLLAGGTTQYTFTYPTNSWFHIICEISLDDDLAKLTVNSNLVKSWPFHYQAGNQNGVNQLGSVNFYAGYAGGTGGGGTYYLDNFKVLETSVSNPGQFVITPEENIVKNFPLTGGDVTLNLSNPGGAPINYEVVAVYDIPNPNPAPTGVVKLTHNGTPGSGIGFTNTAKYTVAAGFTPDMLKNHIGKSVRQYTINFSSNSQNIISGKLCIWKMGPMGMPSLDPPIYEQTIPAGTLYDGENIITLQTPYVIDGSYIYIGVDLVTIPGDSYTFVAIGVDATPDASCNKLGRLYRSTVAWTAISGLAGHWLMSINIDGTPIKPWMALNHTTSTLQPAANKDLKITFGASDISENCVKDGKLYFFSTDYDKEETKLDVKITFGTPPTFPIINVTPLEFSATIKQDAEVLTEKSTITIANTGTGEGTYTITVEADKPWLTIVGDAAGTVAAGGSKTFDVVMDATGLDTIVYTGKVTVGTNDTEHPTFVINCTLTVLPGVGIITVNGVETKIFPNPASDFVTVKCSEMITSIQIMNNMGQVIRTVSVNSDVTHIDTSNLSAGVYFVKVITDKTAFSNKLIIK